MEDDVARAARAKKGSPFLSTEQAALYLGLSARKLQQMRGQGAGPIFRRHSRYVAYASSKRQSHTGMRRFTTTLIRGCAPIANDRRAVHTTVDVAG